MIANNRILKNIPVEYALPPKIYWHDITDEERKKANFEDMLYTILATDEVQDMGVISHETIQSQQQ